MRWLACTWYSSTSRETRSGSPSAEASIARSLEQLQDAARAANGGQGTSLHDAASNVPGKAGANLRAFIASIDVLREQTVGRTLREIIELVLDASGLIEHYRSEREGADRIENLEELVNAAESFVTQEGFGRDAVALPLDELRQSPASQGLAPDADRPAQDAGAPTDPASPSSAPTAGGAAVSPDGETQSPLAAFLTHAALESGDNQAQAGQDAVQLMTVHSAKGLEFDAVFISGLEEGLFPHENSLSDYQGIEEERRLMYVAITRARKRLYLSFAQTRLLHGQTRYHLRSRFFDELPEATLKWLTPKQPGFGTGFATNMRARSEYSTFASGRFDRYSAPATPTAGASADAASARASHGLRPGMQVFHTKFGEGTVITIEGQGDDARAQVKFPRHGVKWLALSVAKLVPV